VALGGTAPWDFVDCQWTVHVKCQYDAAKRVRRSLKAQARDHALGKSPAALTQVSVSIPTTATMDKGRALDMKVLVQMAQASREKSEDAASAQDAAARGEQQRADLQLGVTVEQAANTARNFEKRGTPINYGETIQLLHAKSGKFLKLVPKYRAQAVGCYQVVIDARGSEDSWLSLRPQFKYQIEGAAVVNHDMLQLHSNRRQLSLHFGANAGTSGVVGVAGTTSAATASTSEPTAATAPAAAAAAAPQPPLLDSSVVDETMDDLEGELEINACTAP
jgi:hypothetical protein